MKTLTPRTLVSAVAAAALGSMLAAAGSSIAKDDDDKGGKGNDFSARLSGYNEVHFVTNITPPAIRGAISTKASGSFKLKIDEGLGLINYELTYQDLESDVRQAHIHFGQRHTVGGITVWLCQTATNQSPTAGTPDCPGLRSGTVLGTITKTQIIAPAGQGLEAENFDELVKAIRAGATYANVHTAVNTPGEIRGQIRHGGGHGKGK